MKAAVGRFFFRSFDITRELGVMQFSKEFNDNFFKNISELYIDPEKERRKQAGTLPDDFALYAVQVIMNHDGPIG